MPRPSRHRGKQVHRRGLPRERICVMTGVNDSNETFLEVTGRGALSRERAMDALRGVSVNIIFTISTNAFSPIAPTRIHRIRQRGCAAFGA